MLWSGGGASGVVKGGVVGRMVYYLECVEVRVARGRWVMKLCSGVGVVTRVCSTVECRKEVCLL